MDLFTADVQCQWAYDAPNDTYEPRFKLEYALPPGSGVADLTEEYRVARSLGPGDCFSRISHVPESYITALIADPNYEVVIYGVELPE